MVSHIRVPANSLLANALLTNDAVVDPLYDQFQHTGRPLSEWLRYEDEHTNPTEDLGMLGRTWMVKGSSDSYYYLAREQAPTGEYRHEFNKSGRWRRYSTYENARKAAVRLNRRVQS
jgi:hypothetical protein